MSKLTLDQIAPDLSVLLQRASPSQLRRIAVEVARHAMVLVRLEHPTLEGALREVEGRGVVTAVTRSKLQEIVDALDSRYFDLQEAEGQTSEGTERAKAFRRARAANTVLFAVHDDPYEAATEGIYEANAALGEQIDLLRRLVGDLLGRG